MNIALLVPGPLDAISGGYGYDRRIVAGLRALGHQVRVVELPGRHPWPDSDAVEGARAALESLPAGTRVVVDGLGLPSFAHAIESLERRGAVGLIHHPTALEHGNPGPVRDALREAERAIFPRLARVITTSQPTARRLPEEFGVEPGRIGTVEPGTDSAARCAGSGGEGCAILSVGALIPRKGHDVLLRAVATLPDLEWTLTIAGGEREPAHANGLRALAEEAGIAQRVTFAGEVDDAELDVLWARSDVFALATHWEGYGMAVAEALARGLPVAVTAGGAVADLVPVEAGVVSPPSDVTSFGKALRRLIFDTELRAEMADAAWAAGQLLPRWEDRAAAFAVELERAG